MDKKITGMKEMGKAAGGWNEPRIVISSLETDLYSLTDPARGSYPAVAETLAIAYKKASTFYDIYAMTEGLFISQDTGLAYVKRRTA